MAVTFKALSALLAYPTAELQAAMSDIGALIIDEGLVGPRERADLWELIADIKTGDLYDLQERYVELFDKTRRLSLNLFEHVHGESRDRGQAMVDLIALYEQGGLTMDASELPDYLPLLLEYLSTRPLPEARQLLVDMAPIIAAIGERLSEREEPYAAVFAALVALSGVKAAEPIELSEPASIDADWTEEQVLFGAGDAAGCSSDRALTRIRAARRDARSTAN
jgi:nitrate reductase delta subunit